MGVRREAGACCALHLPGKQGARESQLRALFPFHDSCLAGAGCWLSALAWLKLFVHVGLNPVPSLLASPTSVHIIQVSVQL